MYYYGNSYGYGNSCCNQASAAPYTNGGYTSGYAIVLVLFILLIIILGARNWG